MRINILLLSTIMLLSLVMATACTPVTEQLDVLTPGPQSGQAGDGLDPTGSAGTPSAIDPAIDPESSTVEETPSDFVIAPDSTITPGPSLTPGSGASIVVTVEPDKVTVTPSELALGRGQLIEVTIANGLAQTIYTGDSKSDCSIVILEQWDGANWQPLWACALGRAPLVVAIEPGQGQKVAINPLSTNFGVSPGSNEPAFGEGAYRIKFTYRLEPGPEGEEPYEVYSESLDIQP